MEIFCYWKRCNLAVRVPRDHYGYFFYEWYELFQHTFFSMKELKRLLYFILRRDQKISSSIIGIFTGLEHGWQTIVCTKTPQTLNGFNTIKFRYSNIIFSQK